MPRPQVVPLIGQLVGPLVVQDDDDDDDDEVVDYALSPKSCCNYARLCNGIYNTYDIIHAPEGAQK